MLICIPQLLGREQVAHILDELGKASFVDGRLSAGDMARDVKHNLEYRRPDDNPTEIDRIVGVALWGNRTFQDFALPKHISPPIFSRYEPGMAYGPHVDTPLMGRQSVIRADLALTLFLSDPASYGGGELTVAAEYGEQAIKLPAGDAVVYPATSLHHVTPVTDGARTVALGWVQSYVRDAGMREILHDISQATQALDAASDERLPAIKTRLFKAYANLMRRAADV